MRYLFTDTIGTSGSHEVDELEPNVIHALRWYGARSDLIDAQMLRLIDSLGMLRPAWDEEAAQFLGIKVEVLD